MEFDRERAFLACSAPLLAGGLLALPLLGSWPGKAAAAAVAIGASAALATARTRLRCASLTLALLAATSLLWLR